MFDERREVIACNAGYAWGSEPFRERKPPRGRAVLAGMDLAEFLEHEPAETHKLLAEAWEAARAGKLRVHVQPFSVQRDGKGGYMVAQRCECHWTDTGRAEKIRHHQGEALASIGADITRPLENRYEEAMEDFRALTA